MSYHFTPTKIAKMKNIGNDHRWPGCGATGTLMHCYWEWKYTTILEKGSAVSHNLPPTPEKAISLLFKRNESVCPLKTCTRIS